MSEAVPHLRTWRSTGPAKAVVLVLHGGREHGHAQVRPWHTAYLRMVPLARAVHEAGREHGIEVRLLRNRFRGWNAPELHPVQDARWALEQIRAEHPGLPVVLIGHSLGGRVAFRVADDPAVVGAAGLAPWTPGREPESHVAGRAVLIAHGTRDRMTSPADSFAFGRRAEAVATRVARFELSGEGHAMLRRAEVWTRLICAFTLEVLDISAEDEMLAAAWTKPTDQRLRIPV